MNILGLKLLSDVPKSGRSRAACCWNGRPPTAPRRDADIAGQAVTSFPLTENFGDLGHVRVSFPRRRLCCVGLPPPSYRRRRPRVLPSFYLSTDWGDRSLQVRPFDDDGLCAGWQFHDGRVRRSASLLGRPRVADERAGLLRPCRRGRAGLPGRMRQELQDGCRQIEARFRFGKTLGENALGRYQHARNHRQPNHPGDQR